MEALELIERKTDEFNLSYKEIQWLSVLRNDRSLDLTMMIAKYLGLNKCRLYIRKLWKENNKESFYIYPVLQYYDLFEIDVVYSLLSEYLSEKSIDDIWVIPAEQHPIMSRNNLKVKLMDYLIGEF